MKEIIPETEMLALADKPLPATERWMVVAYNSHGNYWRVFTDRGYTRRQHAVEEANLLRPYWTHQRLLKIRLP